MRRFVAMAVLDGADLLARAGAEKPAVDRPVLICHELRKRFGELEAVRGVSFHIAEGETYGLLGPNGAGKTTTISMVCGLLDRDSGRVTVGGRPMNGGATSAK